MADKIVRKRGRYEGRVVTILEGEPGRKRGNVKIRDLGFPKEVPSKEVEPMQAGEPIATLAFEPPD